MQLKNFKKVVEETPEDVRIFTRDAMDILDRIHELLDEKFDGRQKLLAEKLGKSEAEVSKWLNGVQNFTLRTLAKLQAAFGERIISVHTNCDDATFVQVKAGPNQGVTRLVVQKDGCLEKQEFTATTISQQKPSATPNNTLA